MSFRVLPAGPSNPRRPTLLVIGKDGNYIPLNSELIGGKSIVKAFLEYKGQQLVPAEPLDVALLQRVTEVCSGNKILLCLDETPPFPTTPTVCVNISNITIRNGEWRPVQIVLEINVPETGTFTINHNRYTISLVDNKFLISYF